MFEIVVLNLIWISFSLNTLSKSFLIFPPPRRHVVEHEFLVVSTRVETFSRGKRIRNERKLEKELFCSRFEPVESIYRISMRGIVRKILGNFLSDEVRTDQSGLHLELFLHNYSFGQDGVKRIEKRNGIIRKIRINEEESKTEENKQRSKACLWYKSIYHERNATGGEKDLSDHRLSRLSFLFAFHRFQRVFSRVILTFKVGASGRFIKSVSLKEWRGEGWNILQAGAFEYSLEISIRRLRNFA